jgi:hypothetical protein
MFLFGHSAGGVARLDRGFASKNAVREFALVEARCCADSALYTPR